MVLGQEDVKSVPFSSGTASTDDVSTVGDGHKHSLSGSKDTDESSAPRLSAWEIRARCFMQMVYRLDHTISARMYSYMLYTYS